MRSGNAFVMIYFGNSQYNKNRLFISELERLGYY